MTISIRPLKRVQGRRTYRKSGEHHRYPLAVKVRLERLQTFESKAERDKAADRIRWCHKLLKQAVRGEDNFPPCED